MGIFKVSKPAIVQATATSISGFGDSITFGSGASPGNAWLDVLGRTMSATTNNQGVGGTVLQGTTGDPSSGILRYSTALLGSNKTTLVFSLYGYNDARYIGTPQTTTAAFTADYQTIINGLLAGGYTSRQIVLGSPPWMNLTGYTVGGTPFIGSNDTVMKAYRDATLALAQNNGLFFADVYSLFQCNPAFIGSDNVHPNDTGHAAIAALFSVAGRP